MCVLEELNYKEIFKKNKAVILLIDCATGKIQDVSLGAISFYGYSYDEFLNLTIFDINVLSEVEIKEKMQRIKDANKKSFRFTHKLKNGQLKEVQVNSTSLNINGHLLLSSHIQDITQECKILNELKEYNRKFEYFLNQIPTPIVIINKKGDFIFSNSSFHKSIGYSNDEINSVENALDLLFDAARKDTFDVFKSFFKYKKQQEIMVRNIFAKSGEKLLWSIMINYNEQLTKEPVIVCSAYDMTKIREKDELLLKQSNSAAMGEMISMITHQWKQPLSVLGVFINTLLIDVALNETLDREDFSQNLKKMDEQIKYLSHTMDDFKNFFKPNLNENSFFVKDGVEKAISILYPSLASKNIEIDLIVENNFELNFRKNDLIQVVLTLVNNSKDAILQNEIENGKITIRTFLENDNCITSITDNGGGFEDYILNKLGNAYVSTKEEEGTGLGVYMCKKIVEKSFMGFLKWENVNNGARFMIIMPFRKKEKQLYCELFT